MNMKSHELNREGRRRVEAELLKRGAVSVTSTSRGTRRIHLLATNSSGSRTVELKVKTKQKGTWQTTIDEAKPANTPISLENTQNFWVFVDFGEEARYWIVPESWIRNDIHEAHQQYLKRHGGHRAENDDSNHHSIEESRRGETRELGVCFPPRNCRNRSGAFRRERITRGGFDHTIWQTQRITAWYRHSMGHYPVTSLG
jgi:hypothetical protein